MPSNKLMLPALLLFSLLINGATAIAAPRTFQINDEKGRDHVSFTSDAPIELIEGKTSKITGNITIDDSFDLTKPVSGKFDVDLASIDTGIPLRNEHMRDNFLETKSFPKATFVLKSLVDPPKKLVAGQKVTLKAIGDFSLHGKTVSKTVPVDVTYLSRCPATETKREGCDLLQVKATFNVPFKDHAIKRPEIVFQKLADTVVVTVSASAYDKAAEVKSGKDVAPASKSGSSPANKSATPAGKTTAPASKAAAAPKK